MTVAAAHREPRHRCSQGPHDEASSTPPDPRSSADRPSAVQVASAPCPPPASPPPESPAQELASAAHVLRCARSPQGTCSRHSSVCTFTPSEAPGPPACCHSDLSPTGPRPGTAQGPALRRQTLRENRLRGEGPHDRGLGGPTAQGPALWGEQSIQGWRQGPGPAKPKLPPPTRTRGHSAEDAGLQQKRADAEAEPPHVTLCTPSMQGQAYSTETRPPTLMGPRVRLWSPTAGAHAGLPRLRVGANASAEG